MLNRIPDDIDKREGSIIYDALAPAAIELQNMYIELDRILSESFADTASMEYLIRRASERGITPNPATKAILKAEIKPSSINIDIGSRFSLNNLNFVAIEKINTTDYKVQCETAGATANGYFGNLIPIDYIQGLEEIKTIELLVPGEDAEDIESLRKRYFDSMELQAFGGNIADYKEKVNGVPGVGGCKVFPAWNGGGTVKLTVINSLYQVPSEDLISTIQTKIDPVGHSGEGYGLAPIGHIVTVEGVTSRTINITTNITYLSGWSWEACQSQIIEAVSNYFTSLSKTWENSDNLIIRISQLEAKILDCEGVLDISNTTINGSDRNITLNENEVPERGTINGI